MIQGQQSFEDHEKEERRQEIEHDRRMESLRLDGKPPIEIRRSPTPYILSIWAVDGTTFYTCKTKERAIALSFLQALDHEGATIYLNLGPITYKEEAVYHFLALASEDLSKQKKEGR